MTTGGILGGGAGYHYETPVMRSLGKITPESYDYRDQSKLMSKLVGDVSLMGGQMRKMQKGIDAANQNFIQQLQSLINDVVVLLGGGGDTGLDLGDLKYILQMFGALFGLDQGIFPLNLFNAAWHFFSNFILPGGNFEEVINMLIDNFIATVLDIFGEVPILGEALQQLAAIISELRDILMPIFDALTELFGAFDLEIGDTGGIAGLFGPLGPIVDAIFEALDVVDLPDISEIVKTFLQLGAPLVNLIAGVIKAIALFIKLLSGNADAGDFEDILSDIFTIADPVDGGSLGIADFGTGIIQMFLNPTGLLTTIEGLAAAIGLDFSDPIAFITSLAEQLLSFLGIGSFLGTNSPLSALNLFGLSDILGSIGIGQLSSVPQELLDNPGFKEAISVQGAGIWIWDETDGRTVPGCASVTAANIVRQLVSNNIKVAEDDELAPIIRAKWSGLTYTGTQPVRLEVVRLLYNTTTQTYAIMGVDVLAGPTSPGANQTTWFDLTDDYVVPANTSHICLQLVVDDNASAGTVKFDDASVKKTGGIKMSWIPGLPELNTLVQNFIDIVIEALGGIPVVGGLLTTVLDLLQNIPFLNILGIGGPTNIGGSIQSTWDQWISGLVGVIGTGAGLPDLFNIGQDISGRATLGQMGWDILGIRNNKPLKTGFLPSSISNVNLDKVAIGSLTAPTVPITPTTALMSYHIIEESMPIGAIQFQGYGTTNLTGFYLNIYTMNQTTGICDVLLHNSADIKGLLTGGAGPPFPVTYSLPTPTAVLEPGTIVGIEMVVRGTGAQHNVAGGQTWLQDQVVYPRRWSSVRDSSTTLAPSSITPVYSNNVPAVEIAVSASPISLPHSPVSTPLLAPGTYSIPIPNWVNFIDLIGIGGGGGGQATGFNLGEGGDAGVWNGVTLTRGTHIPTGTTTLNIVIAALAIGGDGGGPLGDPGAAGGNAVVTATGMTTFTCLGGAGGNNEGSSRTGDSPGNYVFNGKSYSGGTAQNTASANGIAPGGGGAGATNASADGGTGGSGAIFVEFRQS